MTAGWETKTLDQISLNLDSKRVPITKADRVGGMYPYYGASGIVDYVADYIFDCDALLVSEDGANLLARSTPIAFSVSGKYWVNNHAHILKFGSLTTQRFVELYLESIPLNDYVTGAAQPKLNQKALNSIPIPYPPLGEQDRIVAILDEAFDGIATARSNAEQNLRNVRALFESHLQAVFSQRGEGWMETILEHVLVEQPRNGWSPPAANHSDAGVPVLTLSAVTGFQFRANKIKFTSAKTDSRRHYWVENGDLLITRSNTPELVGHVAIASGLTEPTIYPDLIMRMIPAPDLMLAEFLYYQLRSPSLRLEITGRAQGANPTMKKISKRAVQTLPIAVPPISTQRKIVHQLHSLTEETRRLESLYQRKLAALDELKKSLLHQAFSGRL
ncbi:type I restriction enzyme, S subunit [Aromatoleum tolulyticum]|uniref:Type I restriction enzyme, S subunit n=1 Tax=Aromatoleum tolulyticum TaxID=34027 RepID=A0A1N6Q1H2_9RHOO|nr:restriction endonuclease subunit S [Aromatoleum tolulyticum]SIQ10393.1 type I restriction enzyme, S subunit [Aromatoleum tolulyticum]